MKLSEMKSKELYNMTTQVQKNTLPVVRVHYRDGDVSVWEDCGLIRAKEIKQDKTLKVFSMRYNRKNLMKYALNAM